MSKNWTYSWPICFLKKLPQFFHLENSARIMGEPHLTKNGQRIDCNIYIYIYVYDYAPCVVPGLSTTSCTTPTPTSWSSSSQDSVFDTKRYAETPVPERSGSASEELRGDPLHESTEIEKKNKSEGREEVQSDLLHELPDWLQEFRENLVDERSPLEPRGNPEPRYRDTSSSSHELPMGSRAKVEPGSGKHSVFTHFPTFRTIQIAKSAWRRK